MIPPPPICTLFPYTTSSDLDVGTRPAPAVGAVVHERVGGGVVVALHIRSEEHTSELQSLRHLVCRLLLEKTHLEPPARLATGWQPRICYGRRRLPGTGRRIG